MARIIELSGCTVALPAGAQGPYAVYLGGVELAQADYAVDAGVLTLHRPVKVADGRVEGWGKKLIMSTAGIGFYKLPDKIDVHFRDADGAVQVASDLVPVAPASA